MGWGAGNLGGGSGGGLNFKVVGNPQPANPKENTIWVNTDAKITGYYFQAEQPEGMAEGEVWISTGTASQVAFNALKKGSVMVYPISAKQMHGGTLVDVTAKSWQNGAWVDWVTRTWLFKSGEGALVDFTKQTYGYCTITETNTSIKIETSGATSNGFWITNETYDLKNAKKVYFRAKCNSLIFTPDVGWSLKFIVSTTNVLSPTAIPEVTASTEGVRNSTETTYEINLENLDTGKYYIGYWGMGNAEIYDVYFE